jgi:ABC-type phosphate/phosphonate transport system substrate-binding protein
VNKFLFFALHLGLLLSKHGAAGGVPQTPPYPPISVGGSVGAVRNVSVTDAEIGLRLLFNDILAKAGERINIEVYDSDNALIEDFTSGKLQVIYTSSLFYFELNDLAHPSGRFVVHFGHSQKQRIMILVRREHQDLSLADLRHHKLSMVKGHLIGKRFLDVRLSQQGLPSSDRFFSHIEQAKEGNDAMVDLFFGKADVALVSEFGYELALELNPQIASAIAVLDASAPVINEIVVVHRDFAQDRLERATPYLLELEPSRRRKQLLETFRITGFSRLDKESLKEVRQLNESYRALTQSSP